MFAIARLDFTSFEIAGPSMSTDSIGVLAKFSGDIAAIPAASGIAVTERGRCLVDTFSVGSPGNTAPPVICGSNDGEHSEWQYNFDRGNFSNQNNLPNSLSRNS